MASSRLAARASARRRHRCGVGAGFRRQLRRLADKWRERGGSLSTNTGRIAQQRIANARIRPRRTTLRTRAPSFRNESEEKYDRGPVARLALWRTNVNETTELYVNCCRNTSARHWREYSDFQPARCVVAQALACQTAGTVGRGEYRQAQPTGARLFFLLLSGFS